MDTLESKLFSTMDGKVWAEELNTVLIKLGKQPIELEFLYGWFANAIMNGYDYGWRAGTNAAPRT